MVPPDILITDQGTHFNNELLHALSNLIGCKHIFSTPYHPQTNRQTERWKSTFVTQVAKFCNDDHNNWDTYLPSIIYAYNHGVHFYAYKHCCPITTLPRNIEQQRFVTALPPSSSPPYQPPYAHQPSSMHQSSHEQAMLSQAPTAAIVS
ncbi:unnamed protein product [Rotaria sp. Silwood2]|nr:unnamed protein product [Rotaria sp. Silwood2]CAF4493286.1 unnamed protein product [Rotaria sp. Silwood2]